MPFRSPKMNGFIFGFHRFVWWPKWTPASSRSFVAIPDKFPPSCLALAELEALARASQTVLLALLHPRVGSEEAVLLESLAQLEVVAAERARDAEPDRAGLAVDATAGDRGEHVEALAGLGQHQRPAHVHAQLLGREELLELTVVHRDDARAG